MPKGATMIAARMRINPCPNFPPTSAAARSALHETSGERPLLIVVQAPGEEPSPDASKTYLDGKIAKWWIPDDVQFIEDMPHTATGKIQKTALRDMFADYQFPG